MGDFLLQKNVDKAERYKAANCSALPLLCNRGRGFIAGARYEHTTYQIFMSGSAWPTIDKS